MEKIGQVLAQLLLQNERGDDELGGPALAFRPQYECRPSVPCSHNPPKRKLDTAASNTAQ